MIRHVVSLMWVLLWFVQPGQIYAGGPFVAYSMRAAENVSRGTTLNDAAISSVGGITSLAGLVFDREREDLILVGRSNPGQPEVSLDDVVVALRSVLVYDELPYVSIERTLATKTNARQEVVFRGHIADTGFGRDLLEADVTLKKLALDLLPTEVWGIRSYFGLYAERLKEAGWEGTIGSRFWFRIMPDPAFVDLDGVFIIRDLRIAVKTEVLYRVINGQIQTNSATLRDFSGDAFSEDMTREYLSLSLVYPQIGRVKTLLDLVALAKGVRSLQAQQHLKYWLKDYIIKRVETPKECDLLLKKTMVKGKDNRDIEFELNGGIELRAMVLRLKAGDATALKEAVLQSRPKNDALAWKVPIEGWEIPGALPAQTRTESAKEREVADFDASAQSNGCFIESQLRGGATTLINYPPRLREQPVEPTRFSSFRDLPRQDTATHVGGVLLRGAASVAGATDGKVDLSRGNFSLMVDGQNAQLDPRTFRKFITALWAVYYSDQDPGISIDPIEWGGKDHMVRYIGRVINTDLGRVMRDADYLMKKWAVGTERPNEAGFMNPDDVKGQKGGAYYGASSRFWFVPENMSFKRSGSALVFDQGRMTVKTEFNLENTSGLKADPSNEVFADFLTSHYPSLKRKHPVFDELFEYAKMVGLAKYLKDSGVPLFWFLMANKDLVLTENSPGTVSALAKGSDYFRNIRIEGGVDMSTKGQYVMDDKLAEAIRHASGNARARGESTSGVSYATNESLAAGTPFNFSLGTNSYSVVPQHSLTSGRDRRGNRYQTDFAVRSEGFQATEEAMDSFKRVMLRHLRYEELRPMIANLSETELKKQYEHLYQESMGRAAKKFAPLAKQIDPLQDREFISTSDAALALKGAIGRELGEKLGPFFAKETHYKTDLELVRWFNPRQQEVGPFGKGWQTLVPYQVVTSGTNTVAYQAQGRTWMCPAKKMIKDLIAGTEEVLTFDTNKYQCLAYVPGNPEKSQIVALYPRTDSSYAFIDKLNNTFEFDPFGRLTDMRFSSEHQIHIDYVKQFADAIEQPPFEVEPDGQDRVEFKGERYYRQMRLKNLAGGGTNETLYFNTSRYGYAAYVPAKAAASFFQMLVAFTDQSYRLDDKQKNQVYFNRQGEMDRLVVSPDRPLIAAISMANQRIDFKYTADPAGRLVVGTTRLIRKGKASSAMARYEYDAEGRLCGVKQDEQRTARAGTFDAPRLAAVDHP